MEDWLNGCEGFSVDAPSGPLGRVVEIRRDPDSGSPEGLVIQSGMFGLHRRDVPVSDIAGVLLGEQLIVLDHPPAI